MIITVGENDNSPKAFTGDNEFANNHLRGNNDRGIIIVLGVMIGK